MDPALAFVLPFSYEVNYEPLILAVDIESKKYHTGVSRFV
jgi:hypothetical protein